MVSSLVGRQFALLFCVLLGVALSTGSREHSSRRQLSSSLAVHEWGTFTSIARADGAAVEWAPWLGKSDLPSFVERNHIGVGKGGLRGTVRMETPVLYFYSPHDVAVSAHVSFRQGLITEWYPRADAAEASPSQFTGITPATHSSISWSNVLVAPRLEANFPIERAASHYYAARETSAAPLSVTTPAGQEHEKFLFYRGVGGFAPPLSAKVLPNGGIELRSLCAHAIPALILFERRGDRLGYQLLSPLSGTKVVESPSTSGTLDSLRRDFEDLLAAQGLYPDEAHAMLETWRDSWFEEGSRLFYIVPRGFVDAVLPLSIKPAPSELTRVFVGRIELVSAATQEAAEAALLSHDYGTLEKQDRFLEAIVQLMTAKAPQSPQTMLLGNSLSQYWTWSLSRSSATPHIRP